MWLFPHYRLLGSSTVILMENGLSDTLTEQDGARRVNDWCGICGHVQDEESELIYTRAKDFGRKSVC
jgi:hypothetical protein